MAFSGVAGVWAMKAGDFIAANFAGTNAGINSAISYAAGGGRVYIGPGTVDITTSIAPASGVVIAGAGMGATILRLANSAGVDVILASGVTDMSIRDLTIDGNKANNSVLKQGLRVTTSTRVTLERVDSHDCEQDGFYISGCTDVRVRGCQSRDNGRNGFSCGDANGRSVRVRFTDCTSSGHSTALAIGFALEPASYSSIKACHSIGDDYGITCLGGASDDASHNVIEGNFILDFGTSATDHVMQGITLGTGVAGCSKVTVAKNFIRANSSVSAAARPIHGIVSGISGAKIIANDIAGWNAASTSIGISVTSGSTRFVISENEIDSPGDYGILLDGSTRGAISNNIIRNCSKRSTAARDAIRLDNSSFDITINGNDIFDDQGTPTTKFGILSQGSSDRLTVSGNQFRGMSDAGVISLSGNLNRVGPNQGLPRPSVGSPVGGTLTLPGYGDVVEVSGTNNITGGITAVAAGRVVTLVFTGALQISNGGNMNLQGTINTTAKDCLTLQCDGTNWFQVSAISPNV